MLAALLEHRSGVALTQHRCELSRFLRLYSFESWSLLQIRGGSMPKLMGARFDTAMAIRRISAAALLSAAGKTASRPEAVCVNDHEFMLAEIRRAFPQIFCDAGYGAGED